MKEKNNKEVKENNKEKRLTEKERNKGEKPNKFIETIKKKWLIDGTKTLILVIIILAIFIGINVVMQKLELSPIDLSQEKLFTLTDASKEKIKDINKEITIYFVEYSDDDTTIDLAKQYTKENEKIKIESVKANDRPDLVQKYGIQTDTAGIIIECGERSKVLTQNDLVTYDTSTYETVNIAEEKLTASIQSVATDNVPKVYFLTGYSQLALSSGLQYFNMYLQNEIYEVSEVDILTKGKVPEDCNTLVITTLAKDLDELATNAITEYINNGGNILWFQAAIAQATDMPNANKILEMYGIKPFEAGIIRETDSSKMLSESPDLILPEIQTSKVTEKIQNSEGVIFINATKINTVDEEKLSELKVEKTELLTTSSEAYFRTNFTNTSEEAQSDDQIGTHIIGQLMTKTLTEANEETGEKSKKSELIIFGENYFIADVQLTQNSQQPIVAFRQNKDLALNSIAYLADREEDITARKSTGTVTYAATDLENKVILAIIFTVPIVIIIAGIVVWLVRRRRK